MVANPELPLFRYDPYAKVITRERYEHARMHSLRREAIREATVTRRGSQTQNGRAPNHQNAREPRPPV